MAGVDLLTNVIIGGQTTAGFNALANRLNQLGATVDKIGSYVREFEKDSVQVYRNYEDNMLAAEYALSAQYDSATELSRVMEDLDLHASEWAATTIFHTSDVSQAINEAAHAGWDYTKIVQGIPQAMLIAQAGGLELSTGLDYLVKMMGSTRTEFGEMGTVIDQWSKAANLSATNIGEMGEAFISMGAAAQFGDSTQELFTLLAVLANVGTTGSQAGTALRGAMMRIIAPTTKAEAAMELLGADAEEINEVLGDTNVTKAAKKLEGLGFSAYDAEGNLLPMIDIFTNLHAALQGLDEQAQNEILAAIFPTRNIASAQAFMAAVGNGQMAGLFESIGDSAGYAAIGADIMMSGLTGAIETLASKWEEFQRSVGETLAPWIEKVAGWLGQIMDAINGMDEATLNGLVGSLTALAGLGPVLLGAGGIVKAISVLGWKGVALTATVVGVGALVGYLNKLNEISFEENFGKIELDLDALGEHVGSLKTQFDNQEAAIAQWEAALESAEEQYATKSSTLAETLLMDVLTGKKLTDAEKKNIDGYAQEIVNATLDGISNAEGKDRSFLEAIFGGQNATTEDGQLLGQTEAVMGYWYQETYAEAEQIGQQLRNALTAALQDDQIDESEREAIQNTQRRLNEIMAEINAGLNEEAYETELIRAQRVSWDSVDSFLTENDEKLREAESRIDETYDTLEARTKVAFRKAREDGAGFIEVDGKKYSTSELSEKAVLEAMEQRREEARRSEREKYGTIGATAFDALMADSDYGDAWRLLRLAGINEDGSLDTSGMFAGLNREQLRAANSGLSELWENADSILGRLPQGFFDTEQGDKLYTLMQMAGQAATAASQWASDLAATGWDVVPTEAQLNDPKWNPYLPNSTQSYPEPIGPEPSPWFGRGSDWSDAFWAYIGDTLSGAPVPQDVMDAIPWDDFNFDALDLSGQIEQMGLESAAALSSSLSSFSGDPIVDAFRSAVAAAQAELDGLDADKQVTVRAVLDASSVNSYQPPNKIMHVTPSITMTQYAEGGRADTASIFGEDGPEWAIPEEHSERTAELLNRARAASGFTWEDLIARYGGLNANPNNQQVTVNYAPTIHARDAEGVAEALEADKARLLRMVKELLAEQRFRDEVEVYA